MLLYLLIGLSLALAGVAGLQLMYLFYIDRINRERIKRLHELELRCKHLLNQLSDAEAQIAEQHTLIETLSIDQDEEAWADVLDDR